MIRSASEILRRYVSRESALDQIADLLGDGITMMEVLDEGQQPWQSAAEFERQARATVPAPMMHLLDAEASAEGHGQYEPGAQSRLAGLLDGLAAVDHAIRGWEPSQHVPGPARAWLPTPQRS